MARLQEPLYSINDDSAHSLLIYSENFLGSCSPLRFQVLDSTCSSLLLAAAIPNLLLFLALNFFSSYDKTLILIIQLTTSYKYNPRRTNPTKMRRDKIVARILLIFSITNVALAAPAVIREIHLDVAEVASEKRGGTDEGNGGSVSGPVPELSDSDSESGSLSGSASPAASFHDGPAYPYSVHSWGPVWWRVRPNAVPYDTYDDSGPPSPSESFHQDPAPEPLTGSLPQGWEPTSPVHQDSSPELPSGLPRQDSASSAGTLPQGWEHASPPHQDSSPKSPSGLLHKDSPLSVGSFPHGWEPALPVHKDSSLKSPSSLPHQDSALSAVSLPQDWKPASPAHQDGAPSGLPHQDPAPVDLPSSSSHQNLVPPESTLPDKFFNDALKHKIKVSAGLGAVVGISAGLVYGIHKLDKSTSSPRTYVSVLFPPSPANI